MFSHWEVPAKVFPVWGVFCPQSSQVEALPCLLTGWGGRWRRARVPIVTGRAGSQTFVHCEH